MAKNILNPLTDTPQKITDLTKKFMLDYVKAKGTKADKEFFKSLYKKYRIEKPSKLKDGETVVGIESISEMRKEFAVRFFPQLVKTNKSYDELVDEL